MAWKGIKHIPYNEELESLSKAVGEQVDTTEWAAEDLHELASGTTLPETGNAGDFYFLTTDGHLYIWKDDTLGWVKILLTGDVVGGGGSIILANGEFIQLGTRDGSPEIFAGHPTFVQEVFIRPKDGNVIGELGIYPKGTQDQSNLELSNAEDPDNCGYVHFIINDKTVYLQRGQTGTGTEPILLTINFPIWPGVDNTYGLGVIGQRWTDIHAYRHHFVRTLGGDHIWSGITTSMIAGIALTIGQAVYVGGDSKMELADADGAATMPIIALATGSITENAYGEFLMQGFFRDNTWDWTPGGLLYASVTPGGLSQTAPVGSGDQVQVVGVAITADIIHFNPSYELVEIS